MSCRHDLASCSRCYPATGKNDPGPEDDYEDNLEGPGAVTREEYLKKVEDEERRAENKRTCTVPGCGGEAGGRDSLCKPHRRIACDTCSRCYPGTGKTDRDYLCEYHRRWRNRTMGLNLKKEDTMREDHAARVDAAALADLMGNGQSTVAPTHRKGYHHLKCWPNSFNEVLRGAKPFEVRLNDRDFRVDDVVVLEEWYPEAGAVREAEGYNGRSVEGRITCVADPRTSETVRGAIQDGYVVLGVEWKS